MTDKLQETLLNYYRKESVTVFEGCCFINSPVLWCLVTLLNFSNCDPEALEGDCLNSCCSHLRSECCYACCPNHPRAMLICCGAYIIVDPCAPFCGEYKANLRVLSAEIKSEIKEGVTSRIYCRCQLRWSNGGAVCTKPDDTQAGAPEPEMDMTKELAVHVEEEPTSTTPE